MLGPRPEIGTQGRRRHGTVSGAVDGEGKFRRDLLRGLGFPDGRLSHPAFASEFCLATA